MSLGLENIPNENGAETALTQQQITFLAEQLSGRVVDSFFLSQGSPGIQRKILDAFVERNPQFQVSIADSEALLAETSQLLLPRLQHFLLGGENIRKNKPNMANHPKTKSSHKPELIIEEIKRGVKQPLEHGSRLWGVEPQPPSNSIGEMLALRDINILGMGKRRRPKYQPGDVYHLNKTPWASLSFHYLFVESEPAAVTEPFGIVSESLELFATELERDYDRVLELPTAQEQAEAIDTLPVSRAVLPVVWKLLLENHPELVQSFTQSPPPLLEKALYIYGLTNRRGLEDKDLLRQIQGLVGQQFNALSENHDGVFQSGVGEYIQPDYSFGRQFFVDVGGASALAA